MSLFRLLLILMEGFTRFDGIIFALLFGNNNNILLYHYLTLIFENNFCNLCTWFCTQFI